MSQFQLKNKRSSTINSSIETWLKSSSGQWIQRIILWAAFAFAMRYVLIGPFYKDTQRVEDWVSAGQVLQTIVLYYFFGYYVFPRYLLKLNVIAVFGWLLVWHAVLYEVNYMSLGYLQQINVSDKIDRDWAIFQKAGLTGFINSAGSALFSFLYSFPYALMFLGVLAVKQVFDYRTKNLKLERDKLNLELDFLKAQVNPHFLFNTLNSVYAYIFDSNERAANLVLQLSELMRYNLYETDQPKIALDKELAYIQNYLNLERNRLTEQQVVIDYQQAGDLAAYQIAPLLLIAFVENAFKHGIKGIIAEPAYVQVTAEVNVDEFVFTVENSLPPKRPMAGIVPKSGGIGLVNVRRRLDALYPKHHRLDVTAAEDAYTVVLTIRLEPLRLPTIAVTST